jgi:mannose-1-phosphate guanylyltransferase
MLAIANIRDRADLRRRLVAPAVPANWWSIVLAGGNGERLSSWVRERFGEHRPKQYCTVVGSRSMFQHTLDRADAVTVSDQKVSVIAKDHRAEVLRQVKGRRGRIVAQPVNRNTAAGVFLALSVIRAQDPGAVVIVYPSDHFVTPEEPFIAAARQLLLAAVRFKSRVVLLGAAPDRTSQSDADYGWITAASTLSTADSYPVRSVAHFVEKPDPATAAAARRAGGLWNTFVFAAKAETLWELGRRCVPAILDVLAPVGPAIGTPAEDAALERAYRNMPEASFSRDVLERAPDRAAVIQLAGTHWSDWGRPERIVQSLARTGRTLTRHAGARLATSCA